MSDPVGVSARPTAYSNSVGNQLLFPEVKSKRNRHKKQVQDIMNRNQPIISRSDAMRQILETSKAKCSCAAKPCLEKISPTWEGCVDAFLSCRSVTQWKQGQQLDEFVHELAQKSKLRLDQTEVGHFERRFTIGGVKVCRYALCNAYNITPYALQKACDPRRTVIVADQIQHHSESS